MIFRLETAFASPLAHISDRDGSIGLPNPHESDSRHHRCKTKPLHFIKNSTKSRVANYIKINVLSPHMATDNGENAIEASCATRRAWLGQVRT